jgi:hypothetical protein
MAIVDEKVQMWGRVLPISGEWINHRIALLITRTTLVGACV